jgi:hypothetical protein
MSLARKNSILSKAINIDHSVNHDTLLIPSSGTVNISGTLSVSGSGSFSSNLNLSNQTASTIASFDSSKNIVSLDTATYPSFTELSYVKGVTSALQTQIDAKASTSTTITAGSGLAGGGSLASNRTIDIGQGDGISVSADSIAVDSTVVRTTGTQTISGAKTFQPSTTFSSGVVISNQAANTIASFDANSSITSLSTSTYPSFTELSYVKGVTSALQTQLDSKAPTASPTFTGTVTCGDSVEIGTASATNTIVEVGKGATGNRFALIDFIGDTTYTDYGLRIGRTNGGANSQSVINHRGTNELSINAEDAGSIQLRTNSTPRLTISSTGVSTFTGTARVNGSDGSTVLLVNGGTKGVRFNISSASSSIEGVDSSGVTSYQPLVIGGSTVTLLGYGGTLTLATAGASAITIDGSQKSTLSGQLLVTAGSASACGVGFSGDPDTGIAQLNGANTISLVTNESERLQINADGNAIFTRAGEYALVMRRTDTGVTNNFISAITYDAKNASGTYHSYCRLITQQTDATAGTESGQFYVQVRNNGTERSYVLIDGESDTVKLLTGGTERVLVDASGNVGITGTARVNGSDASTVLLVNGGTKGVRFNISSASSAIEGVDSGGVTSYQPLVIGGSTVTLATAGASAITIDGSQKSTLSGQLLVTAGSGSAGSYKPGLAVSGDDDTGLMQFAANTISVVTGGNEAIRIGSNQSVMIGVAQDDPIGGGVVGFVARSTGLTQISRDAGVVLMINRRTNDGALVQFFQDSALEGDIAVADNTISYNAFCGSHWAQLIDNSRPAILRGTVLETIDEMCEWPGEPRNDRLPRVKVSDTPRSRRVYGVFMAWDDDDPATGDMYCTALGAYMVRVSGVVQSGDLLESAGDGTARAQPDDIVRSSTIGKVSSTYRVEEYDDGSYLVPCVLMCG